MTTAAQPTTPSWVPALMGALLTVAATWGTIQTQVPAIVEQQVAAQLEEHRLELALKADSLWASTEAAIMARVDSATTHAADTVLRRLGIMQQRIEGQPRTMSLPTIVVQRDTALERRVDMAMAVLLTDLHSIRQQLDAQQGKDRPNNRRGKDR